jgi:hypothetical protein
MPNKFSSGKYAIAQCDRCGFRYKLSQLKTLVIKTKEINIRVCPECWEEDHPQLKLGMHPVNDPQAVRNPRTDTTYQQTRGYIEPLYVGAGIAFSVGAINDINPTSTSISYFSGGLFAGGLFKGGFFNVSSSYTPPSISTGYFSGGMFSGGMFASKYF